MIEILALFGAALAASLVLSLKVSERERQDGDADWSDADPPPRRTNAVAQLEQAAHPYRPLPPARPPRYQVSVDGELLEGEGFREIIEAMRRRGLDTQEILDAAVSLVAPGYRGCPTCPHAPGWDVSTEGMRKILAENVGNIVQIRARFAGPKIKTVSVPLLDYQEYPEYRANRPTGRTQIRAVIEGAPGLDLATMANDQIYMDVGNQSRIFSILAVRVPEREATAPVESGPSGRE